jgi:hypothetical protein
MKAQNSRLKRKGFSVATEQKERRLSRRYAVSADFSYTQVDANGVTAWGRSRILNMSAYGVLFDVDRVFKPGTKLELSIPWPGTSGPSKRFIKLLPINTRKRHW